jgi:hypothetical protein
MASIEPRAALVRRTSGVGLASSHCCNRSRWTRAGSASAEVAQHALVKRAQCSLGAAHPMPPPPRPLDSVSGCSSLRVAPCRSVPGVRCWPGTATQRQLSGHVCKLTSTTTNLPGSPERPLLPTPFEITAISTTLNARCRATPWRRASSDIKSRVRAADVRGVNSTLSELSTWTLGRAGVQREAPVAAGV